MGRPIRSAHLALYPDDRLLTREAGRSPGVEGAGQRVCRTKQAHEGRPVPVPWNRSGRSLNWRDYARSVPHSRVVGRVVTAVVTNIFLDAWLEDSACSEESQGAIDSCLNKGSLAISPNVVAELVAHSVGERCVRALVDALDIGLTPIVCEEAIAARALWRQRRGQGRDSILPDYLIPAGVVRAPDRLLMRDMGLTRINVSGLV